MHKRNLTVLVVDAVSKSGYFTVYDSQGTRGVMHSEVSWQVFNLHYLHAIYM